MRPAARRSSAPPAASAAAWSGPRSTAAGRCRGGAPMPTRSKRCGSTSAAPTLPPVPGSVADDADGAALADALRACGRRSPASSRRSAAAPTAAACSTSPPTFLRRKLDEDLLPHLAARPPPAAAARRGRPRGSYLLIGGPGSEHPWAGYGHRSIGAAALRMLARVLHDEARARRARATADRRRAGLHRANRDHASAHAQRPAIGQRAVASSNGTAGHAGGGSHDRIVGDTSFGPVSGSPAGSCPSLVAVRALLGRFSRTGYNKDLSS